MLERGDTGEQADEVILPTQREDRVEGATTILRDLAELAEGRKAA